GEIDYGDFKLVLLAASASLASYLHLSTVHGKRAYSLAWGLQYVNLFMIRTGYIILVGQALKVCSVR
ncbi:unnamed protein product, partial [Linum tenue]